MGKGERIKAMHVDQRLEVLLAQKEELIRQLALERTNTQHMNIVIGCLVKRFGGALVVPDTNIPREPTGWRILVTDEEFEALDGELQVHRSVAALGMVLTLHEKKALTEEKVPEKDVLEVISEEFLAGKIPEEGVCPQHGKHPHALGEECPDCYDCSG
jgi:hypothetical protein